MVTRLLWEQELQFKSDVFDQLVSQHAFHKIPFLLFLALQKWSNRTQQAKYIMRRSQAVKAGSFEVPIAKVRFFPAQFICHSGGIDLHIYFRGRRRKACEFESRLWHHGHRMVAYRLLISFDCHYYSQLASDGAVVLCKLGDCATVVQLAERQISNLNVAGSYPVSRSTRSPLRCTGYSEPKETYML